MQTIQLLCERARPPCWSVAVIYLAVELREKQRQSEWKGSSTAVNENEVIEETEPPDTL